MDYKYIFVVDGNDRRSIDVGILSRYPYRKNRYAYPCIVMTGACSKSGIKAMVQIVCFNALNNKIYLPASCLAQIPPIAEYLLLM